MAISDGARRWLVAAPIGTGVNIALLTLLAREPPPLAPAASPPMIVTLERIGPRPAPAPSRERPSASAVAAPTADTPGRAAEVRRDPPVSVEDGVEPEWRVDGGVWLDPSRRDNAMRLHNLIDQLRYARACAGLSNETLRSDEKERCLSAKGAAAARAAAAATPPPLKLDPAGRFARDSTPYLTRKPTNGCRPRVAGAVPSPGGRQGATAGVGCALPF